MAINIIDGFYVGSSTPIDSRIVVSSTQSMWLTEYKYDGLKVFVTSNRTSYIWNAGTNTWDIEGSSSTTGTGTPNYITKWTNSTTLGNSNIYATSSKIGINDSNPLSILSLKDSLGSPSPLVFNNRYISGSQDSSVIGYNWYLNGTLDAVNNTSKSSTKIEIGNAGGLQVQTRTAGSPATFNTVLELNNLSGYNFLRGLNNGTFISGSVSFGTGTTPTMSSQLVYVNGSFRTDSSFHSNVKYISQTSPTYTVVDSDHELIFVTTDNFTINLPTVTSNNVGRILEISNNNNIGKYISLSPAPYDVDNTTFSRVIQASEKVKLVAVSVLGGLFYNWKITEIVSPSQGITETWKYVGTSGDMVNGQPIPTFNVGSSNFGSPSQNLRLRKMNNKYFHFQGTIQITGITSMVPLAFITTLPIGYRPIANLSYPTILQDGFNFGYKSVLSISNGGIVLISLTNGEILSSGTRYDNASMPPGSLKCYIDFMVPID